MSLHKKKLTQSTHLKKNTRKKSRASFCKKQKEEKASLSQWKVWESRKSRWNNTLHHHMLWTHQHQLTAQKTANSSCKWSEDRKRKTDSTELTAAHQHTRKHQVTHCQSNMSKLHKHHNSWQSALTNIFRQWSAAWNRSSVIMLKNNSLNSKAIWSLFEKNSSKSFSNTKQITWLISRLKTNSTRFA